MAKLTKADVLRVSNLANLPLTDKEVEKHLKQLGTIVEYISELNEVDTSGTEATSQTTGLTGVTRNDVLKPEECLTSDEALSGTEEAHNGYFKVQGILEEKSDK